MDIHGPGGSANAHWEETRGQRRDNFQSVDQAIAADLQAGGDGDAFTYTVQAGDTLWDIAEAARQSNAGLQDQQIEAIIQQISAENNIENPSLIRVGQELNLASLLQAEAPGAEEETVESDDHDCECTESTGEPVPMTRDQKIVQAMLLYSYRNDDMPIGNGDVAAVAESVEDPEIREAVLDLNDHIDELSALDGTEGDLSVQELQDVMWLVRQGYDIDFLVQEGGILQSRPVSVNGAENFDNDPSALRYHDGPGEVTPDQEEAVAVLLQHVCDENGSFQIPEDGTYNRQDVINAAALTDNQGVRVILMSIANNMSALSALDGVPGDLTEQELAAVQEMLANGYDLDFLFEEGSILERYGYDHGTTLNEHLNLSA